jgi:hypothetical protein
MAKTRISSTDLAWIFQEKLNAFDTKVTKLKHHVGGRKLKGVVGKPAQSKQHGIEQVRLSGALLSEVLRAIYKCSGRKVC